MADVLVEFSGFNRFYDVALRGGVYWTSSTVGYAIYINAYQDLKYNKTADGGATWGGAVNIKTGTIQSYDSWADWQTAGDAGTKIHIAYVDSGSGDVRYIYLDTSDDSAGGDDQIEACQGSGTMYASPLRLYTYVSITKARGGNLAVAFRYRDSLGAYFYEFYTSPDATTWTSKTSPWEASLDYILLFPGNEIDNQDIWATFWDMNTDEISLKTYDDSGNSWSEQSISLNMYEDIYIQMDGQVRMSDGHLIFAAWSRFDNAASDLMVWDINGAGSITAKTNVITDTAEYFLVSVFVNQVNDDIYITYVGGTAAESQVATFYQKSTNGGANWDGQTAMQANVEDDERWISSGAIKAAWGGKFMPYWFNADWYRLYTNTDNGITIPSSAVVRIPRPGVVNFQDPAIV